MAEDANEALLYAVESFCLQGVKAALRAGADVDYAYVDSKVNGDGSALLIASTIGHVGIVRLLLRKGASVSKRSTNSTSCVPLHAAVAYGHTEVVDLLVRHGATLDVRDALQRTPLMAAIMFKQVDTVRQLIEFGARVDLADDEGKTAQEYCMIEMIEDCHYAGKKMMRLIREAMRTKLLRCCNPSCGKPGYRSTLKLCGGCKLTRYCSEDCQKQHWSVGHKKCCGHDAYTC